MTYYRVKPKKVGLYRVKWYQVQWRSWWTLWIWQPLLSFETWSEADEYIDERMKDERMK